MLSRLALRKTNLISQNMRAFRPGMNNLYKQDPTPMSESERVSQQTMPVWDRVFDHKKYMQHDGQLKLTTGIAFLDVEPFPRMKLMKLYYLALQELRDLPDNYGYKFLSRELTRYRMKIVDETTDVR